MATHKSAAKRARQTIKRTARNTALRSRMRHAIKGFMTALTAAEPGEIDKTFGNATRQIRRAVSKNVLHRVSASRYVSRLSKARHKALTAAAAG